MQPPLKALHVFEAFARRGSMSAAAMELCVTHGAVSRQIRQLELSLGVALVQGPKTRLVLTEAGLKLADQLTTAFRIIETALPEPRGETDASLHVSCFGTLALKWLIPRLPRFHAAYPSVQLRISESYGPCDFRRDAIDLAIRISGNERGDVEATPFLEQFHGPVVAPDLLRRNGDPRALLETLPKLYAQSYPQAWAEWRINAGVQMNESQTERVFEHNAYMIEAAAAGLGAAICPWAFVMDDLEKRRLVAPFGFVPTRTHYVALRPRERRSRAASQFRNWLIAEGALTPRPPGTHATSE